MKKENQSHRSENKLEKPKSPAAFVLSQEELNNRKKKAVAQIYDTFNQIFSQQDLTKPLLIDEADIPQAILPTVPFHKVYPFIMPTQTSFFGNKTSLPDFKTLYKTILYKTRMDLNNERCFHREDIKKSIILPTLCKDNILYCKEGELLHQISLDGENPRFVTRNILTKKDEFLCEDKMSEILTAWLEEEKAYELYNKLKPLYDTYIKGTIQPLQSATLPTIQQAYLLNVYKAGYEVQFHLTNNVFDNHFQMLPILCDSNKIISKAGNRYYKIDLSDEHIRFEKLIKGTCYLMTPSEMNTFVNNVCKSELFGKKTGTICAWLKSYYNKEIAPLCQEDNLVPANALDEKNAQRKKIESGLVFQTRQDILKNMNQRSDY